MLSPTPDSDLSASARLPHPHARQTPHRLPVIPYIALRSGEGPVTHELKLELRSTDTWGLAYADETPDDRDTHDVLWRRYHHNRYHTGRPTGAPLPGQQHPDRLRETMSLLHCAVCNHPADRSDAISLPDQGISTAKHTHLRRPPTPEEAALF
ncbi:hypothetical protein AB0A98_38280 [Streptomyces chrestomyceticus]|uniref:hypothetical protein n=1 Tax=Streptomyces chrestomyceticus TaxID=68185 RepID=UPI00340E1379